MFLEAVAVSDGAASIVTNRGLRGERVWRPMDAVANHFYPSQKSTAAQVQWLPGGCGMGSTMRYCI